MAATGGGRGLGCRGNALQLVSSPPPLRLTLCHVAASMNRGYMLILSPIMENQTENELGYIKGVVGMLRL